MVQTEGLLVAGDGGGGGPSPSPSSTPLDQGVREETEQTNCPADVDVVHGQHRPASGGQLGGSEPDLVGQEEDVGGEEDGQSLVGRAPASRETEKAHHQERGEEDAVVALQKKYNINVTGVFSYILVDLEFIYTILVL